MMRNDANENNKINDADIGIFDGLESKPCGMPSVKVFDSTQSTVYAVQHVASHCVHC